MGNVTDSIYSGVDFIIPMADVCFIEKKIDGALFVIMNGSTWNAGFDNYNNAVYMTKSEAERFLKCWYRYRHELESENIVNLMGDIK